MKKSVGLLFVFLIIIFGLFAQCKEKLSEQETTKEFNEEVSVLSFERLKERILKFGVTDSLCANVVKYSLNHVDFVYRKHDDSAIKEEISVYDRELLLFYWIVKTDFNCRIEIKDFPEKIGQKVAKQAAEHFYHLILEVE
jgi:hypothetical protein